eukprot:6487956-Amphidinium_carterae.1
MGCLSGAGSKPCKLTPGESSSDTGGEGPLRLIGHRGVMSSSLVPRAALKAHLVSVLKLSFIPGEGLVVTHPTMLVRSPAGGVIQGAKMSNRFLSADRPHSVRHNRLESGRKTYPHSENVADSCLKTDVLSQDGCG